MVALGWLGACSLNPQPEPPSAAEGNLDASAMGGFGSGTGGAQGTGATMGAGGAGSMMSPDGAADAEPRDAAQPKEGGDAARDGTRD